MNSSIQTATTAHRSIRGIHNNVDLLIVYGTTNELQGPPDTVYCYHKSIIPQAHPTSVRSTDILEAKQPRGICVHIRSESSGSMY